jgi:hypothetical protein
MTACYHSIYWDLIQNGDVTPQNACHEFEKCGFERWLDRLIAGATC